MPTVTKDDIAANYPLPVYSYKVDIDGETVAFSEVSGLNLSFETTTYKESLYDGQTQGGPNVMAMPAQLSEVKVTLKKGLVKAKSMPVLYDWLNTTALNKIDKKDIVVSLCDESGAPVVTWTVKNAFPNKLDMPTLDTNSNDVAIETMELTADRVFMGEA
jgi:phage tail-like protein